MGQAAITNDQPELQDVSDTAAGYVVDLTTLRSRQGSGVLLSLGRTTGWRVLSALPAVV